MKYKDLDEMDKAKILDKLVVHAETIEKGNWLESAYLTKNVKEEVTSHAIAFLKVVRDEANKITIRT